MRFAPGGGAVRPLPRETRSRRRPPPHSARARAVQRQWDSRVFPVSHLSVCVNVKQWEGPPPHLRRHTTPAAAAPSPQPHAPGQPFPTATPPSRPRGVRVCACARAPLPRGPCVPLALAAVRQLACAGGRAGGPLPSRGSQADQGGEAEAVAMLREDALSRGVPRRSSGSGASDPQGPGCPGPQHAPGLVPPCGTHTRFLRRRRANLRTTFPAPTSGHPALGLQGQALLTASPLWSLPPSPWKHVADHFMGQSGLKPWPERPSEPCRSALVL